MLILSARYPGNFDNPDADHPLGKFKNRSAPGVDDGSYAEKDWSNDHIAFAGAMLNAAALTPNGNVDNASTSQMYEALQVLLQNQLKLVFPVGAVKQHPVDPGLATGSGGLGFGTWSALPGRSLIGAGQYTDGNNESRTFTAGTTYGEFSHKLTAAELPEHDHTATASGSGWVFSTSGTFNSVLDGGNDVQLRRNRRTGMTGGNESHNNLPPVYAVNIWVRTA